MFHIRVRKTCYTLIQRRSIIGSPVNTDDEGSLDAFHKLGRSGDSVVSARRYNNRRPWFGFHNARQKRTIVALLVYTAWNIWNERNRRIFEDKLNSSMRVFNLAKEEMARVACGQPCIHGFS